MLYSECRKQKQKNRRLHSPCSRRLSPACILFSQRLVGSSRTEYRTHAPRNTGCRNRTPPPNESNVVPRQGSMTSSPSFSAYSLIDFSRAFFREAHGVLSGGACPTRTLDIYTYQRHQYNITFLHSPIISKQSKLCLPSNDLHFRVNISLFLDHKCARFL
jgi:hypothetical protein